MGKGELRQEELLEERLVWRRRRVTNQLLKRGVPASVLVMMNLRELVKLERAYRSYGQPYPGRVVRDEEKPRQPGG